MTKFSTKKYQNLRKIFRENDQIAFYEIKKDILGIKRITLYSPLLGEFDSLDVSEQDFKRFSKNRILDFLIKYLGSSLGKYSFKFIMKDLGVK